MSEHSKESVEAYPDRLVTVFAGEALDPAVLAERTAFDRGFAVGKANQLGCDLDDLRDVVFAHCHDEEIGIFAGHPLGDKCYVCDGLADALFASGIIRQSPPKYVGPPDGWFEFGSHAGGFDGPLEFSTETDDSGMPKWERHPESGENDE